MTRNIGGRVNIAHNAGPAAVLPPFGAAQLGEGPCLCGQGPSDPENRVVTGASFLSTYVTCPNVGDMRVEISVNAWDADDNSLSLQSRVNIGGPGSYFFEVTALSPSSWANAEYKLSKFVNPTTTVIGGPTTLSRPAPGDVLELSTIGTAIVASRNGTPLLSVADSAVVAIASNEAIATGLVIGNADFDIVYEDYCP